MAHCGANYRCCSLLGRGKGRVLIPGKVVTSSGLKRELSSNILELYMLVPQGQDFDKCYLQGLYHHVPLNCQYMSALFHFGLQMNHQEKHLHHNAKQEDRLQSSEALSLYQALDTV